MRVLVTGGAGFIGSHTVALLVAEGHEVVVLDDLSTGARANLAGLPVELIVGNITDVPLVERVVAGCTHVLHLAAKPSVPGSCDQPVGYDVVNVHGAVVVFEAARRAGVQQLAYASSSAVYGASEVVPKVETMPVDALSPYAAAKGACELYARTYSGTLGLPCVGLRYFNVFGPRQDPNGAYAAVIPRFVSFAVSGEPLTVFGDGEQARDFVSVADVARANLAALTTPGAAGGVYNIGTGRGLTLNRLIEAIRAQLSRPVSVIYDPPRPGDVRVSLADVGAARGALGWAPRADFDQALAQVIAWFAAGEGA